MEACVEHGFPKLIYPRQGINFGSVWNQFHVQLMFCAKKCMFFVRRTHVLCTKNSCIVYEELMYCVRRTHVLCTKNSCTVYKELMLCAQNAWSVYEIDSLVWYLHLLVFIEMLRFEYKCVAIHNLIIWDGIFCIWIVFRTDVILLCIWNDSNTDWLNKADSDYFNTCMPQ